MAELVSIKRNVDVSPGQAAPAVFHCSQGDVGSKIILGLLNNGTTYAIPSGVTVTIEGSESNGSIFTPISATASGSDITFYLTGEMTAVAGPAICQAVLKSGSNILGTANFTLEVESSPMGADAPPVFTDAGWTWMLNKLNTEFVPALGNETIIDAIDGKLDKNQGTANAGKYLKVGADGNVTAEETDKTLSIADKAADAKAVGDEINDLKADLSFSTGTTIVLSKHYNHQGSGAAWMINQIDNPSQYSRLYFILWNASGAGNPLMRVNVYHDPDDTLSSSTDIFEIGKQYAIDIPSDATRIYFVLFHDTETTEGSWDVVVMNNSITGRMEYLETTTQNEINWLKNDIYALSDINGTFSKYFSSEGSSHSAALEIDKIKVNFSAGTSYRAQINIDIVPDNNSCQVWAYYTDGTNELIGALRFNTISNEYTASKSIMYIGISTPVQSSSYNCHVAIIATNSILNKVEKNTVDIRENANSINVLNTKVLDASSSIKSAKIYAKTFSTNGASHSSNNDILEISIKENVSFKVHVSLNIAPSSNTFQCYATYIDGSKELLTTNYLGRDVFRVAKKDIVSLGFTIPSQTSAYTCTAIVDVNADMSDYNVDKYDNLLQATRTINLSPNSYKSNTQPFVLLHFSDLHGETENLRRIVNYKEFLGDLIDDAICTGDMVVDRYNDGMAFWNSVTGADDILMTIGNHDALAGNSGYDWTNTVPQTDLYSTFIAPYVTNWNCTYTQNLTYYYKDYSNKKVRLICLNCMLSGAEAEAQLAWFNTALTEATSLGYYVIVATHYPIRDTSKIVCNFSSLDKSQTNTLDTTYMAAVNNFVVNGGKFACYIAGHTHWDDVLKANNYDQMCVVIDAAGATVSNVYSDTQRTVGSKSWDCVNMFIFDGATGVIKIIRVGADQDHYLRLKKNITFRLTDFTIVTQN